MIAKNMELLHHKTKLSILGAYMVACEMHSLGARTKKTKNKNKKELLGALRSDLSCWRGLFLLAVQVNI